MRRRSLYGAVAAITAAIALSGCSEAVYTYARTTVGIDVTQSTPDQTLDVTIGYKRRFVALVPEGNGGDSVSVLTCTRIEKDGLFDFFVDDALATGEAATGLAGNADVTGAEGFRKCFRDPQRNTGERAPARGAQQAQQQPSAQQPDSTGQSSDGAGQPDTEPSSNDTAAGGIAAQVDAESTEDGDAE